MAAPTLRQIDLGGEGSQPSGVKALLEESRCQGSTIPASWNGVNNDSHHSTPLHFTKYIHHIHQAFREGQVTTCSQRITSRSPGLHVLPGTYHNEQKF